MYGLLCAVLRDVHRAKHLLRLRERLPPGRQPLVGRHALLGGDQRCASVPAHPRIPSS
jgi:hypothetical protein